MPRSKSGRPNRRKTSRRRLTSSGRASLAPRTLQFIANPTNHLSCAFTGSLSLTGGAETVISINSKDILFAAGGVALTTTSLGALAQSARIKRVEVILNNLSAANVSDASAVGITWFDAGERSSGQNTMNMSLSSAFPARAVSVPNSGSFPAMWFAGGLNSVMFDIIIQPGPLNGTLLINVRVDIDWVASNQSYAAQTLTTAATLSVGSVYYTPLDGVSSHNLLRVGLPSTF